MSADEYTPTTEEVRWYVSNNGRIPVEWFDRFLAAHDAEVAAKALEEAAQWWLGAQLPSYLRDEISVALSARAAEIRKGAAS